MRNVLYWAGSLGMVGLLGLMAYLCLSTLGVLPKAFPQRRAPAPTGTAPLGFGEALAWAFAALAVQWAAALLAQGIVAGGLAGFWEGFWQRFTTAGDSPHYLYLAQYGYAAAEDKRNLIVFYPLYPLLIRLLGGLLGGRYALAGLAISQGCWAAAAAAFRALAGRRLAPGGARAAAAAFLFYPFSFFALGVYTEGLFLLLSVGCLYALERRWWGGAGLAGLLAALCRTQGLALVFAAGYAVLAAGWRPRKGGGAALWAVAGPAAGYGGYLALNWAVHGDAFRYLYYQSIEPWYQHAAWFGDNLAQQYGMAVEYPGLARYIYIPQLVVYFVAVAALGYLYWRGVCHTAAVYSTAYFGMSYLSSWLISGGRYMFGCIGIFLALGALPKAPRRLLLAAEAGLLLLYAVYYRQGQAIM